MLSETLYFTKRYRVLTIYKCGLCYPTTIFGPSHYRFTAVFKLSTNRETR